MWRWIKGVFVEPTQDTGASKRMEAIRSQDEVDARRRGEIRERLAPTLYSYPASRDAHRESRS